jgi:hypothetical protein
VSVSRAIYFFELLCIKNHVYVNAVFTAYDCNYGLFKGSLCFFSDPGMNPSFFGTNKPFCGMPAEDFLSLQKHLTISNTFPLENYSFKRNLSLQQLKLTTALR